MGDESTYHYSLTDPVGRTVLRSVSVLSQCCARRMTRGAYWKNDVTSLVGYSRLASGGSTGSTSSASLAAEE
jgi:hypothetical protein